MSYEGHFSLLSVPVCACLNTSVWLPSIQNEDLKNMYILMQSNTLTNKGLPDSYGRPNRDSFSVYRRIPEVEDLNRAKFTKTKSHEKPNQLKKLAID